VSRWRAIALLCGLGLWALALGVFLVFALDENEAALGHTTLAVFLLGPPLGGVVIGAAAIGRRRFALGSVLLLVVGISVVSGASGSDDAEGDLFLAVVTLPSAVIGVLVGLAGAWLVRRIAPA
jgi:hypothetical protein